MAALFLLDSVCLIQSVAKTEISAAGMFAKLLASLHEGGGVVTDLVLDALIPFMHGSTEPSTLLPAEVTKIILSKNVNG